MTRRGGTVDSPGRRTGARDGGADGAGGAGGAGRVRVRRGRRRRDAAGVRGLGTVEQVEQVEPESAVVDVGGVEVAVHAKLYGKVVRIRSEARYRRTLAVPFRWYCRCSGGVRQRCLSVP